MITALHISDFHINHGNELDIQAIADAFFQDIYDKKTSYYDPSVLFITGDLAYSGADDAAYARFKNRILNPLVQTHGFDAGSIFVCPGNHDLIREEVEKDLDEIAQFRSNISNDLINEFYRDKSNTGKVYKAFEKYIRFSAPYNSITKTNPFYNVVELKGCKLSVIILNTAIFSTGGLGEGSDYKNIGYPEHAFADAISSIPEDQKVCVIGHHPLGWFFPENERAISRMLSQRSIAYFHGHNHEPSFQIGPGFDAHVPHLQSGAFFQGRSRYVGYQKISVSEDGRHLRIGLRTYFDKRREFSAAEDICAGGVFYPNAAAERHWSAAQPEVNFASLEPWISGELNKSLHDRLNDGLTSRPLQDIFVPPRLLLDRETLEDAAQPNLPKKQEITLTDILSDSKSYIITGRRESGKSVILKQIASDILNNLDSPRLTVPVIIDGADIGESGSAILKAIRAELPELSDGNKLKDLAREGLLTVMIDDFEEASEKAQRQFKSFIESYPKNKYIVTSVPTNYEIFSLKPSISNRVDFKQVEMAEFRRKDLRSFVRRWGSEQSEESIERQLNQLTEELFSINLPFNAVTATILMVTYEGADGPRLYNKRNLVERYIEIILKKYSKSQVSSSGYDYKNRVHFLSHIAQHMARKDIFSIKIGDARRLAEEYSKEYGFDQDPVDIIEGYIHARVFEKVGSEIRFRVRTFQDYFTAESMLIDDEFRSWVLDESRFLKFASEIEFYAGEKRADLQLVEMIADRLDEYGTATFAQEDGTLDPAELDDFKLPEVENDRLRRQGLLDVRRLASDESVDDFERDEILETEFPFFRSYTKRDARQEYSDVGMKWAATLALYTGLFKQMDFLKGDVKEAFQERIYEHWAKFILIAIPMAESIAARKAMTINGISYKIMVPEDSSPKEIERHILANLPIGVSTIMATLSATEKHALQYKRKKEGKPLIYSFFDAAMLGDIGVSDISQHVGEKYETIRQSKYLLESFVSLSKKIFVKHKLPEVEHKKFQKVAARSLRELWGVDGPDRAGQLGKAEQKLKKAEAVFRLENRGDD